MRRLVQKAGELGMLGERPAEYTALGLSFPAITYLTEKNLGSMRLFVSVGAHTVIGTLPILYFGTPEQKPEVPSEAGTGRS